MRRALTFLFVAGATAAGSTWWLYDGDWADAVQPVIQHAHEWNADALAVEAGIADPTAGPPAAPEQGG